MAREIGEGSEPDELGCMDARIRNGGLTKGETRLSFTKDRMLLGSMIALVLSGHDTEMK